MLTKEKRGLSGGIPCSILVVILRLCIGPHFKHMHFYGLINLVIINIREQCHSKEQEYPVGESLDKI